MTMHKQTHGNSFKVWGASESNEPCSIYMLYSIFPEMSTVKYSPKNCLK